MCSRLTIAIVFGAFAIAASIAMGDDQPFGDSPPDQNSVSTTAKSSIPERNTTDNRTSEQRIRDALTDDRTTLEFVDIPLSDIIAYLKDRHHIPIVFDDNPLKDAAIDPSALPVSINVQNLSLRSGMKMVLSKYNLAYLIQNEVLLITTKDKADSTLTMRIYDVHDLVPSSNETETAKAMTELSDILSSVPSWHSSGDHASIKPFNRLGINAFAITQNADTHEEIEKTLTDIRRLTPLKPAKN